MASAAATPLNVLALDYAKAASQGNSTELTARRGRFQAHVHDNRIPCEVQVAALERAVATLRCVPGKGVVCASDTIEKMLEHRVGDPIYTAIEPACAKEGRGFIAQVKGVAEKAPWLVYGTLAVGAGVIVAGFLHWRKIPVTVPKLSSVAPKLPAAQRRPRR